MIKLSLTKKDFYTADGIRITRYKMWFLRWNLLFNCVRCIFGSWLTFNSNYFTVLFQKFAHLRNVTSIFTNVLLCETIEFLTSSVEEKDIKTTRLSSKLSQLILICTEGVVFMFQEAFYRRIGEDTMGSLLGPVSTNIFTPKLKTELELNSDDAILYLIPWDKCTIISTWRRKTEWMISQLF